MLIGIISIVKRTKSRLWGEYCEQFASVIRDGSFQLELCESFDLHSKIVVDGKFLDFEWPSMESKTKESVVLRVVVREGKKGIHLVMTAFDLSSHLPSQSYPSLWFSSLEPMHCSISTFEELTAGEQLGLNLSGKLLPSLLWLLSQFRC